jgi:hypothetical protein
MLPLLLKQHQKEEYANVNQQCLAIDPCPLCRCYVPHVGHHISRTTAPSYLACTKRPATGVQPRVDDLLV